MAANHQMTPLPSKRECKQCPWVKHNYSAPFIRLVEAMPSVHCLSGSVESVDEFYIVGGPLAIGETGWSAQVVSCSTCQVIQPSAGPLMSPGVIKQRADFTARDLQGVEVRPQRTQQSMSEHVVLMKCVRNDGNLTWDPAGTWWVSHEPDHY